MSIASDKLPRVSTILQVLDDAYMGVPQALMDKAADRGIALHGLCLSYLASLDGLCEEPVPTPQYTQAHECFKSWTKQHGLLQVATEESSVCTKYGYRGTPDAMVILGGKYTVLDLKFTASILRINKVQIQAYRKLDLYHEATQSVLLHINPTTGETKAHIIPNNPRDWAAFLNALSVWRWRQT